MYFVKRLRSGIAKVFLEDPNDGETYIEMDELPEGDGILRVTKDGRLYFENPSPEEQAETPDIDVSELTEALNILTGGRDDDLNSIIGGDS